MNLNIARGLWLLMNFSLYLFKENFYTILKRICTIAAFITIMLHKRLGKLLSKNNAGADYCTRCGRTGKSDWSVHTSLILTRDTI